MTIIFNQASEKEKRRQLRQNPTKAESIVWQYFKGKKIANCKFRRQYSIGPFVVDFYCPELKLAIEIDGESHDSLEAQAYDLNRQQYIEAFGISFLRFTNQQIYENAESVMMSIVDHVNYLRKKMSMLHHQALENEC
ncbi:endonuclease domain-containing protein [Synechocystis sp. LKSZ1]|uniref:endonuclease domain-containing protein n=1 Tax=Synechocystis sp. LKSZ1 TaxID=3144951 RepID=UPI00336C10D1